MISTAANATGTVEPRIVKAIWTLLKWNDGIYSPGLCHPCGIFFKKKENVVISFAVNAMFESSCCDENYFERDFIL